MECWVPEAGEGGKREPRFPGYRVSVWDDEKVLEIVMMVVQQCKCT